MQRTIIKDRCFDVTSLNCSPAQHPKTQIILRISRTMHFVTINTFVSYDKFVPDSFLSSLLYIVRITLLSFQGKFYLEDLSGTVQLNISKAISFLCLSSNMYCCLDLETILSVCSLTLISTSFTVDSTQSLVLSWLRVSLQQILTSPFPGSWTSFIYTILTFSGWYEDSVFHVNAFGFPPTEPSSFTRWGLALIY